MTLERHLRVCVARRLRSASKRQALAAALVAVEQLGIHARELRHVAAQLLDYRGQR